MNTRMLLTLAIVFSAISAKADELLRKPQPRGKARIIYIADAMSDVASVLPDDPTAVHLRRYVDSLANNGVDVYGQDIFQKQGVCWFYPRHKDHAHFQASSTGFPNRKDHRSRSPSSNVIGGG